MLYTLSIIQILRDRILGILVLLLALLSSHRLALNLGRSVLTPNILCQESVAKPSLQFFEYRY